MFDRCKNLEKNQIMQLREEYGLKNIKGEDCLKVIKNMVASGGKAYTKSVALANLSALVVLLNMGFNSVEEIKGELIGFNFQYFWPLGITASLSAINDVCGFLYDLCRFVFKCGCNEDAKIIKLLDIEKVTPGELIKSMCLRVTNFGAHVSSAIPAMYSSIASLAKKQPESLGHGNAEFFLVTAGFATAGLLVKAVPFDKWIDKCSKQDKTEKKLTDNVKELHSFCRNHKKARVNPNEKIKQELIQEMKNVAKEMPDKSWAGWLTNVLTEYGVPLAATAGLIGGLIKIIQAVNAGDDQKLADGYWLAASKLFTGGATFFFTLELGMGLKSGLSDVFSNVGTFFKSGKELFRKTCCCDCKGFNPSGRHSINDIDNDGGYGAIGSENIEGEKKEEVEEEVVEKFDDASGSSSKKNKT